MRDEFVLESPEIRDFLEPPSGWIGDVILLICLAGFVMLAPSL